MTKNIFTSGTHKGFDSNDIEHILSNYVDSHGICKICGQDHSFKPTFEIVITSIDVIPQLLQKNNDSKAVMEVQSNIVDRIQEPREIKALIHKTEDFRGTGG